MDQPTLNNKDWKQKLTPEQYKVLREKGTEAPFTGEYVHTKEKGMYRCAACGNELFSSETKFDSGAGWPSFDEVAGNDKVVLTEDHAHGMNRVEVTCAKCGGHLGHLFDDGPTKTGKRFCINSCALELKKEG
ncbi:peptide-methionine (R)-S-oxide reductase MsrB [Candidatus Uhrbacteria bacterium]|nr:peptide-methionine (R)-S-oxide reductase MsrB [Candidatus Uhrbacteria bacterium]